MSKKKVTMLDILYEQDKLVDDLLKDEKTLIESLQQKPAPVKLIAIEKIKKDIDPYFKLKGGKEVYIYRGYCRDNKKYEGQAFYDMGKFKYLKKGTLVEVDFEF